MKREFCWDWKITYGAALLEALAAGKVHEEQLADLHLLAERAVLRRCIAPLHDGQHDNGVAAAGVRIQRRERKYPGRHMRISASAALAHLDRHKPQTKQQASIVDTGGQSWRHTLS
jgi:hypothetical protein